MTLSHRQTPGAMVAAKWLSPLSYGLALVFLMSACCRFDRDWRAAGQASFSTKSMAGRWEGTWHSDVNGHHDRLRCLITAQTNGIYSARFHANYRKVFRFRFSYTVPLRGQPRGDEFYFEGAADLGWYAGGLYHYRGHANATNFFSTYECKYDRGTFEMSRKPPGL